MIPFSLYIKNSLYFLKLWLKVYQIFLLFSLYFSSLNLKYLKYDQNHGYNPFCDETLQIIFEGIVYNWI